MGGCPGRSGEPRPGPKLGSADSQRSCADIGKSTRELMHARGDEGTDGQLPRAVTSTQREGTASTCPDDPFDSVTP
jgi:hypothetical protein